MPQLKRTTTTKQLTRNRNGYVTYGQHSIIKQNYNYLDQITL